jgi:mono/diheme cytochrome c family protein
MKKLFIIIMLWSLPVYADEPKTVRQNWNKHCKKCHGADGVATKIGLRLKSPENIYEAMKDKTVEEIFEAIRDGKNKMPGFKKKLSKQEIEELAAHIDYSSLVKKVMDRRGQMEKELNEIQENYEVLPEYSQ